MTNSNGNADGHGPSQEKQREREQEEFLDYCEGMVDDSGPRAFAEAVYWVNRYADVLGSAGIPKMLQRDVDQDFDLLAAAEENLLEQLLIRQYSPGATIGPHEEPEVRAIQLLGEMILHRNWTRIVTGTGL